MFAENDIDQFHAALLLVSLSSKLIYHIPNKKVCLLRQKV